MQPIRHKQRTATININMTHTYHLGVSLPFAVGMFLFCSLRFQAPTSCTILAAADNMRICKPRQMALETESKALQLLSVVSSPTVWWKKKELLEWVVATSSHKVYTNQDINKNSTRVKCKFLIRGARLYVDGSFLTHQSTGTSTTAKLISKINSKFMWKYPKYRVLEHSSTLATSYVLSSSVESC